MDPINILDHNHPETEKPTIFKFQVIEFVLIGLYGLLLLLKPLFDYSSLENALTIFCYSIFVFLLVRIYFEYKHQLITGFGVVLKLLLLNAAMVVLFGMLFQLQNWEFANVMVTVSLMTFAVTHIIYPLTLKDVTAKNKGILFINAMAAGILAVGTLFKMENWANGEVIFIAGYVLTLISLVGFKFLFANKVTPKEHYHSLHFLARSLAILILSLSFC
jgi:hypothetical protein